MIWLWKIERLSLPSGRIFGRAFGPKKRPVLPADV